MIEVKVPALGESISEATIGQWLKADGDMVEADEIICEIESEKATLELPAEETGVLSILAPQGETVSIGAVIARIEQTSATERVKPEEPIYPGQKTTEKKRIPDESASSGNSGQAKKLKISPVAKNIIDTAGLDVNDISGTGVDGKITKKDALAAVEKSQPEHKKASATAPNHTAVQSGENRDEKRVPMTTLRKTISRRLLEAKNNTAMLTTINEIDMKAVIDLRNTFKESFQQKYGVKLGFMSFFTKAVCQALMEFPIINASMDGDEIVYHNYFDIGIAVSTDRGLVVPVMRNAGQLSMAQIEAEINRLAERAMNNKLSIDELSGGTFSITNGGVFGSLISTPIINTPQSAILGMHTIQERPVALDGQVVIRPMMYVALSYDHRLIDGKDSVNFLIRVKEIIENPVRILLQI
ncbi:MAG: 2-oxoglutarate dehydrogenase complex dihydrolipoyllysine-residue succinyltransferase [Calditrichaceae bacterium]|nr:2-oxoglutarate dehydrogenase complex dihydrolipoyllysine-residue succinyltransferase [Calditrichaceae bacterium]MBN2708900.1 2-oxoglutarate dehydrogenase complex dihydrolipoyllysine-residue succinyltransferase [Calditrichaceae bacterium]RQV97576.1 MAG: 2-oxoglutarate dehydrogenase complex dihydrolipoyllysine-residue succinyltransferase [Calditrichota bacterium]